jgi:metal-dependent amidase/aminoacylase/carboxypeptidase family protein
VAIGLLRQHAEPHDQVHGIVTLGGVAPNIVPAHAVAKYYVRATTMERLEEWQAKVERCFEAGAIATGSSLSIEPQGPIYSEFTPDVQMVAIYRENAIALGRTFSDTGPGLRGGSTDMANVSLAIPAIHPMLGIESFPAVNHQPEFTAAAAGPPADRAVHDGAAAMAWTIIDLARDTAIATRLQETAATRD